MTTRLKDIAEATGYEISTISKVLRDDPSCYASDETKQLIIETARRLDYVPDHFARTLRNGKSRTIGVVSDLGGYGFDKSLKSIAIELPFKGHMPLICDSTRKAELEKEAIYKLRSHRVDGVILQTDSSDDELSDLIPEGLPCVLVRPTAYPGCPSVVLDRTAAFAEGVRRLAALGHRKIAFVHAVPDMPPLGSTELKLRGYRAAMEELGRFDERLVMAHDPLAGDLQEFVTEHAARFTDVTAVLAANDHIALGVISGLARIGRRVPDDCSVIGYDNTDFGPFVCPRLSSFDPRLPQAGAAAVRTILDLVEGKSVKDVTIEPVLVERESVAPCGKPAK